MSAPRPDQHRRASVTQEDVTIVIGLEVHVQLDTESKLFCGCATSYGAEPNTQTCPACTGMPGSLPVLNRRAIELAVKTGHALDCEIARVTKWDRKNYFYPDLPKGYQISQFDRPICGPGHLEIEDSRNEFEPVTVRIERAHLEEDAGKSLHDESGGGAASRIDLNRTGTPLLEIVTRPDLRSPAQAKAFLTELKLILTYIAVSDCNMQQGSLRCDGNINLHIEVDGTVWATPIVEIKNMNSFRNAERSLSYEAERQLDQWIREGTTIDDAPKQTRGWDDRTQTTTLQREKEDSADYRYFPDPDLLEVHLTAQQIASLGQDLGSLPRELRQRLQSEHGLKPYDADVLVGQGRDLVTYYLTVADGCGDGRAASNWIGQEVLRHLNESESSIADYPVPASELVELLKRVLGGELDQTRGKEVLDEMVSHRVTAAVAIQRLGIEQVDSDQLDALCRQLIAEHESIAAQIRDGNVKAVGALIGKARKLNPNVSPGAVRQRLLELINAS